VDDAVPPAAGLGFGGNSVYDSFMTGAFARLFLTMD
jgi:hypothetical protein